MVKKYAKAYTEVLEILKHIPEDEYEKIPKTEIQFYESYCDKSYKFEYDDSLRIDEQKISREANAVIISLYMNYFANEKQKGIITDILKQNTIDAEKEKSKKYDVNNMFSQKNISENLPIQINTKKENFIKKIINKVKSILKK